MRPAILVTGAPCLDHASSLLPFRMPVAFWVGTAQVNGSRGARPVAAAFHCAPTNLSLPTSTTSKSPRGMPWSPGQRPIDLSVLAGAGNSAQVATGARMASTTRGAHPPEFHHTARPAIMPARPCHPGQPEECRAPSAI